MLSQRSVFTTIAFLSLEEAFLRSTFVDREMLWRAFRGMDSPTDEELEHLKLGWAVQIANTMHCEIFAIFMAKFIVIATRLVAP